MTTDPTQILQKLIAQGPPQATETGSAALKRIGMLIDLAGDLGRDDATVLALEWCDLLREKKLTKQQRVLLDYFRANAWANRKRLKHRDPDSAWQWNQPELQNEIFHLRSAAHAPGFEKLSALRRCQILTNLGNQLNTLGRCVEAVAVWTRALSIDPKFGMARGNRGSGLTRYASSLYDNGHRGLFLFRAHEDLHAALSPKARYVGPEGEGAIKFFAGVKKRIEPAIHLDHAKSIKWEGHRIGRSASERQYRRWTLHQGLFLNPLNDLGPHSIAAIDLLSLPSFTSNLGEPPSLIAFFDQMKQEFVSGRWLLFEGLHSDAVHFSDRDVVLYNTLDYPSYSLAVEKVKAAFRIVYSVLDKVAFFLNDYAKLGIPAHRVYFRTIWYEKSDPARSVRPEFLQSKNLPFRALYWLAKDLFDPALKDTMEPDAKELYTIRNHLEHSYLRVHEILIRKQPSAAPDPWTDRLAYSVSRSELNAKTIQLYRMARAALIYLALGMHHEENKRDRTGPKGLKMPMSLDRWSDTWKV
ncbi:LA2681 family HEPN domain-containing protein [Bradyrhizobium iriomotense]|uniref:LA2681-like HEPN domain-containing protein n=1 Tax=Bradyrhizobium iriomotense TaxID=441950 RepID=A0ABQ6B8F2_9BRAD|nr:LA2681 family HEPN domain-containing protein [Bradyrhizobium iriomotense]GLR89776.1 hypothetical protein GCM10007857_64900 [Bradyrhizobium iriomotense]